MESAQQHKKLFVGGVARDTTEDTLTEHFSRFGRVEESLIIRDKVTGTVKGFGFVTFSDSSMANEALREEHVILGRKVDVKPANNKSNRQQQQQLSDYGSNGDSNTQYNTKKIFVGGLPHDLTEEEFKSYFESFGTVVDVVVISGKENHRPRGFGFITFDSEHAVDDVLKNSFHELKNKLVEVKRAEPKDRKQINCYDCYRAGLGFGGGFQFLYYNNCFIPFYGYLSPHPDCNWNPYGFGGHTGGWVPHIHTSSSNGRLTPRNPSSRSFGGGVYRNGWASHHNRKYNHTTESIPNGNSNNDTVLATIRSPLSSSNSSVGSAGREDRSKDIDDSSILKRNVGSNSSLHGVDQRREIDDSSALKRNMGSNSSLHGVDERREQGENQRSEIDDSSSLLEHQNSGMDGL